MRQYKKPKKADKMALATARTLLTAGLLAVVVMILYYGIVDGWDSVIAWFSSRWACLVGVLLLLAGTAAMWLWSFFKRAKELKDEEA